MTTSIRPSEKVAPISRTRHAVGQLPCRTCDCYRGKKPAEGDEAPPSIASVNSTQGRKFRLLHADLLGRQRNRIGHQRVERETRLGLGMRSIASAVIRRREQAAAIQSSEHLIHSSAGSGTIPDRKAHSISAPFRRWPSIPRVP